MLQDTGKPAADTGTTASTTGNGVFERMNWDETGICISFTADLPDSTFGIAQTGLGADGWYDEDCTDPNPSGEPDGGYAICHPVLARTQQYCLRSVGTPEEVVAGSTTLFSQDDESDLTYAFFETASGECFTWGNERDYFLVAGCTPI